MNSFDPEELTLLQDAARRSAEGIEESEIFLALFSPKTREDPVMLIQIALALILDKPFYILAPQGAAIPENVRRLAHAIEQVEWRDRKSYEAGVERLLTATKSSLERKG